MISTDYRKNQAIVLASWEIPEGKRKYYGLRDCKFKRSVSSITGINGTLTGIAKVNGCLISVYFDKSKGFWRRFWYEDGKPIFERMQWAEEEQVGPSQHH